MDKAFTVVKRDGTRFSVMGSRIEVDGLGTRVRDETRNIVFTTPEQAEVFETPKRSDEASE